MTSWRYEDCPDFQHLSFDPAEDPWRNPSRRRFECCLIDRIKEKLAQMYADLFRLTACSQRWR